MGSFSRRRIRDIPGAFRRGSALFAGQLLQKPGKRDVQKPEELAQNGEKNVEDDRCDHHGDERTDDLSGRGQGVEQLVKVFGFHRRQQRVVDQPGQATGDQHGEQGGKYDRSHNANDADSGISLEIFFATPEAQKAEQGGKKQEYHRKNNGNHKKSSLISLTVRFATYYYKLFFMNCQMQIILVKNGTNDRKAGSATEWTAMSINDRIIWDKTK